MYLLVWLGAGGHKTEIGTLLFFFFLRIIRIVVSWAVLFQVLSLSTRRRAFDSGTFSRGKAHRFHPFPGPFCQNVCHWWNLPFIGLEVLASSVTLPLWKVIRDFQWSICFRFVGEEVTIGKGCVDTNSSLLLLFLGVPTSLRRGSSSWDLGGQWKSV